MQTRQKGEAAWATEGSPLGAAVKTTPVTPVKRLPVKRATSTRTRGGGNNGVIKQLIKILRRHHGNVKRGEGRKKKKKNDGAIFPAAHVATAR